MSDLVENPEDRFSRSNTMDTACLSSVYRKPSGCGRRVIMTIKNITQNRPMQYIEFFEAVKTENFQSIFFLYFYTLPLQKVWDYRWVNFVK